MSDATHPDISAILDTLYHPELKEIDLSLDRIKRYLDAVGAPHTKLPPTIHVAGTNGKGSVVAFLRAILEAAGKKVHVYTSPHLVRFNERIVVASNEVDDATLLPVLKDIQARTQEMPLTFFEATTVAAFQLFAEHEADYCLLETGMGGQFDATNVLDAPLATVITPITKDHAEFLGETIREIAYEKACIMRKGAPCIAGPQLPGGVEILSEYAENRHVPLYLFNKDWRLIAQPSGFAVTFEEDGVTCPAPNLAGGHQVVNAAMAVAVCEVLKDKLGLTAEQLCEGVSHAKWPARLQRLTAGPWVEMLPKGQELWLDGGHNPAAGEVVADWASESPDVPLIAVCGMVKGKDVEGFLTPIAPVLRQLYAVDIPNEPASQSKDMIAQEAEKLGISCEIGADIASAVKQASAALEQTGGRILVCGSLYLAGKVLEKHS